MLPQKNTYQSTAGAIHLYSAKKRKGRKLYGEKVKRKSKIAGDFPSFLKKSFMLTLQEKIKNLETILNQNVISLEDRQKLWREIKRLKQELTEEKENLT